MRKRSTYRPRPVVRNPVAYVLAGLTRADTGNGQVMAIRLRNHLALEAVLDGTSTVEDLSLLGHSFNMSLGLAKQRLGDDYRADLQAGADALKAFAGTGVRTDEGVRAISYALAVHDAQLDICTVQHIERGLKYKGHP